MCKVTQEMRSQKHKGCENVNRIRILVHSDRRSCGRLIAEELNIKKETVRQIITKDLGMTKMSSGTAP
jgi:DNA-directed RNA polymerase sigma subunit (sigma70/sigma32)